MTLRRVVASPVVPQAVVCFEPPDDGHDWMPWFEDDGSYPKVVSAPQKLEDGCWSLTMDRAVEGRTSVAVARLEGMPTGPPDPGQTVIISEDDPRPLDLRVRGARAVAGRPY